MRAIMIDIETLGVTPGSMILEIGAVEFTDAGVGDKFHVYVKPEKGFNIDPDTVEFWLQNTDTGLELFQNIQGMGVDLETALSGLLNFCMPRQPHTIWLHRATMDIVLLEEAYRRKGLKVPWTYRMHRDTRTLYEAAGIVSIGKPPRAHRAVDDAAWQADWVIEAWRILRR